MSQIDDYINGADTGTVMPAALAYTRLRATRKPDPYNPKRTVEDWTNPDRLTVRGFMASSSSRRTPDGSREETASAAVLTIPDPTADIQIGDRIERQPYDGRRWEVTGFPSNDVNPWTGWQPTLEIQLEEWKG